MSGAVHSLDTETLPETLPLFPLTGVLLLPHGNLPLNIFEPRYLNMTIEALVRGRLLGVSRFRILAELEPAGGYRWARAGYESFAGDLGVDAGATDRPRLLEAVKAFFRVKGLDADGQALDDALDEALVTSLSMLCPFEPREKQALLECAGLTERGKLLTELMEMALQEAAFH